MHTPQAALRLIAALVATTALACHAADADPLAGDFGHGSTRSADTVVWTVKPEGKAYRVTQHGDGAKFALQRMADGDRRAFWKKMSWPEATGTRALCAAGEDADGDKQVFCFVPPADRAKIDWLSGNKSDHFHHSHMGGVMEIHPVKRAR